MGSTDQLTAALAAHLEPGETARAWRAVVTNAKIEGRTYETTLALLGPRAFRGESLGAVTGSGQIPDRTNLVVVTDRRVLWCNKGRFAGDPVVQGSDHLGALQSVSIVPARIALAKLKFLFHDGSVVQFDLPSDHKAEQFANDIQPVLQPVAA